MKLLTLMGNDLIAILLLSPKDFSIVAWAFIPARWAGDYRNHFSSS